MNNEEALRIANEAIFAYENRHLKDIEAAIISGALDNKSYPDIAQNNQYEPQHIKNVGKELWSLLSKALGEKVSKKNFKSALDRRAHSEAAQKPQEPEPNKAAYKNTVFLGREGAIADLKTLIKRGAKVIGIYGKGGIGKTTLAQQYFEIQELRYLELQVGMDTQYITSVEGWVKDQLRYEFREEPNQDLIGMLEQLRYCLQNQPFGVLIDNLETALDEKGKFYKEYRAYIELINRVLNHPNIKSPTLITSREYLIESKVRIEPYQLQELDEETWREFFSKFEINTNSAVLSKIHKAYGGNALAMKVLCYPLKTGYDGNIEAYWQHNREYLLQGDIKDLIASQFNRLEEQDIKAYRLLCRLSIYRYQDIPIVSLWAINSLLWDVPEYERRSVFETLQNRYLVEFYKGEYWLHAFIREEAISRLRKSEESLAQVLHSLNQEIAYILNDTKYQKFLTWLNNKSISLKNEDQVPYKASALRALYFDFELDLADNRIRAKLSHLFKCTYALDKNFYFGCEPSLDLDHSLYFVLVLARALAPEITFYLEPNYADEIAPQLLILLQKLKEEIPEPYTDTFKKWRKEQGKAWLEKLQFALFNHRYIGLSWKFTPDEKALLKQYYEANRLLLDCINNPIIFLDRQTKDLIEEALFMPISELALPTESIK